MQEFFKDTGIRKKRLLLTAFTITMVLAAACSVPSETSHGGEKKENVSETESGYEPGEHDKPEEGGKADTGDKAEQEEPLEGEAVMELCRDIYEEAAEAGTLGSLEVTEAVVNRLGGHGYTAVDWENQINMTNPETVMEFCESVDEERQAEATLLAISASGGLTKYQCRTKDGKTTVIREDYQWKNGRCEQAGKIRYAADTWQYTKEGYLLFGGSYDSKEDYVLTLSEGWDGAALRVQPLDETCREYSRSYLLPIGYGQNNLFLTDWSEEEFGALDFYDVFDRLYPILKGRPVPYKADENLNIGAEYQIPAEEFETVAASYFAIDKEELRERTAYVPEDGTYRYRPRGFYESDYSDIPFPEVTNYTENADGTITLFVNAVYPEEYASCAFSHKTVIRPLSDGGFQYVSNEVLPSGQELDLWWHSERLTEEEWEELYLP